MSTKKPINWFFTPITGVFVTLFFLTMEMYYPLNTLMEYNPHNMSWLDFITFYWIYFVIINGYHLIKRLVLSFIQYKSNAS